MKSKHALSAVKTAIAVCAVLALCAEMGACKTEVDSAPAADTTAPAVVTNINAQAGDKQVVLTWSDPADADLYGIRIAYTSVGGASGNIRAAFTDGVLVAKGAQTYIVTGLTNGTEYTFSVYAVDTSQNESAAATAAGTPADSSDKTAPAEVALFAAAAGDAGATLSWTEPADSDYYGVKITASPAAGTLTSPVVLLKGTTTLSVTGLTNATPYMFTINTMDTSLNISSEGKTANATPAGTGDTTPPANVTRLTATNKDASVLLTWKDAADSDVYGYEVGWNGTGAINRAATSTAVAAGSMIVAQGAGGCYISNLVNGTSYTFTVKSVDTSGNKSTGVTSDAITPSIIEQSPLSIACAASTTVATNQNVTVTVSVSTAADSAIKKVSYAAGTVASAPAVLSSGTALAATNGAYTFTVSANGSFTAAALDTAGREECAYITVSNIDKTAPAKITNLAAGYSSAGSTLTVTWTKPADSDLNHYSFLCTDTTNNGATVKSIDSVDAATTKETLTASADGIAEGHTYSFTVYAYDAVGNKSEAATASFTTAATTAYTGISVYRTNYTGTNTAAKTHLDTAMSDRSMTVVLTGSNLTKATTLVVKSKNTSAGTVVTLASPATASDTERVYTFDALTAAATYSVYPYTDDDGAITSVVATYTVTAPAAVTKVALATAQFVKGTSGREVTATITGTNLDIRGVTTVQVLDSAGTQVGATKTIGTSQTSATTLSVDVPVPSDEGHYTVQAYIGGTASGTGATLWVYGTPTVASVHIPTCGTKASVETVPVTISGTNFSGVTGVTNTITVQRGTTAAVTATISSATSATASISIPSTAGDYTVTVYINGTASAVTGTLTVVDDTGYDEGDVLLDTTISKPVAVLYYDTYGRPFGLGLSQSSSLTWAPSTSTGYSTNFTAIQSSRGGSSGSYTFTGDTDGSDNWEEICKVDSTASTTAATNYPAFNYANTYGSTYCSGTSFTSGWYLPSAAELYEMYKNRTVLDNGLAAAGGEKFSSGYYWSSSQDSNSNYGAWYVDFSNGGVGGNSKYGNLYVRVIRAFNNLTNLTIASPAVTSVSIPACSTTGGTVPVTVYGAYLNANSDTVTVTCNGTDYNATLYGSYAVATVTIPTTAGSYTVTVKFNGTEKLTSTLVCKDYDSATCVVGNILCSDGSVVTKADFKSGTKTAVAVICGTNAGGAPLGVGLSQSGSLRWAPDSTTGYTTNFTATVCTPSATGSGAASTATFTGDTYGGDNWDAVCAVDGTASANAAGNYPAFNYANTYTAASYTSGWYVPSISELCTLYKNMTTINASLATAGGTQIGTNSYWSSSQYSYGDSNAWDVYFSGGLVGSLTKNASGYVRVIRAF